MNKIKVNKKAQVFLFSLFLIVLVAPLLSANAGRVGRHRFTFANSLWQYTPEILDVQVINGDTIMRTREDAVWSGTFEGTSTEQDVVVISASGAWSVVGFVFFEGEVNGESGTLLMYFWGSRPDGFSEWDGQWLIESGTGELENLNGRGIFWGPGAPDVGLQGDIYVRGFLY